MSTRSFIGMQNDDGSIRAVYAHLDGSPDTRGTILLRHYTDPEKIDALLDQGDISSLRANIGEEHDFDNDFEFAQENEWTTFYGRDRGERGIEARTYANGNELTRFARNSWAEFVYVFNKSERQWYVVPLFKGDGSEGGWNDRQPLTLEYMFRWIKANLIESFQDKRIRYILDEFQDMLYDEDIENFCNKFLIDTPQSKE